MADTRRTRAETENPVEVASTSEESVAQESVQQSRFQAVEVAATTRDEDAKGKGDPAKVAATIAALSDEDRMVLLAALGVPEAQRQRIVSERNMEAQARAEQPLAMRAGVNPIDKEATKEMNAKKAAAAFDVDEERVFGYAVRAPLNVDGEPIPERRVLVVSYVDGTKDAKALND